MSVPAVWTVKIFDLLSDGKEYSMPEIVAAVGPYVPPENAVRTYMRRARGDYGAGKRTQDGTAVPYMDRVAYGRKHVLRESLLHYIPQYIEALGGKGPGRRYKLLRTPDWYGLATQQGAATTIAERGQALDMPDEQTMARMRDLGLDLMYHAGTIVRSIFERAEGLAAARDELSRAAGRVRKVLEQLERLEPVAHQPLKEVSHATDRGAPEPTPGPSGGSRLDQIAGGRADDTAHRATAPQAEETEVAQSEALVMG